jgi:hypothetical protein
MPEQLFTLDNYLHGRPARMVHAQKTPKILIVWHHGNEELAPRVAHYIYTQRPDLVRHVDYICGDPQAAEKQAPAATLGYDVNRSYYPEAESKYAHACAQEILRVANGGGYDFVLDLHTTTNETKEFFIIRHELDDVAKRIIAASPVVNVVAMPDHVLQKTLLGYAPKAIALECNEDFGNSPAGLDLVVRTMEVLVGLRAPQPIQREVFYVDRLIMKADDPGDDADNFVLTPAGYYPILLGKGKHSYRNDPTKDYACFGARHKQDITL